jgi:4a-hydroxytetrahydrobiopterin dehydratase
MDELTQKQCKPCEGGVKPFTIDQAKEYIRQINGWSLEDGGKSIQRKFSFKDFHQTMAFVNALAWIAHSEDHHPNLEVSYSSCTVNYATHSIAGLSENDFICAAKIDNLIASSMDKKL